MNEARSGSRLSTVRVAVVSGLLAGSITAAVGVWGVKSEIGHDERERLVTLRRGSYLSYLYRSLGWQHAIEEELSARAGGRPEAIDAAQEAMAGAHRAFGTAVAEIMLDSSPKAYDLSTHVHVALRTFAEAVRGGAVIEQDRRRLLHQSCEALTDFLQQARDEVGHKRFSDLPPCPS